MNEILIALSMGALFGIGYWYGYTAGVWKEQTRYYRDKYAKNYGDGT